MTKKIIVTGGAGYIGGQTVLKLLDTGHSVFAIDRVWTPDHRDHVSQAKYPVRKIIK
jgi:nucleoside-diphosphate-sugar epimerase